MSEHEHLFKRLWRSHGCTDNHPRATASSLFYSRFMRQGYSRPLLQLIYRHELKDY